jgi:hypothetical protein
MINQTAHIAPRAESNSSSQLEKLLAEVGIKRITDQILLHWGTIECDEYLNSLLINDRERQRAGFPPAVSKAIFAIIQLNDQEVRAGGEAH